MPRYQDIPKLPTYTPPYVPPRTPDTPDEPPSSWSPPAPPPGPESPFGPGMLDFINVQMGVGELLFPNQGFLPSGDYDYSYMEDQIGSSIDPAMDYAEQFGLQDILGYPEAGGMDFFAPEPGGGSVLLPPLPPTQTTGYQPPEVKWHTGTYEAAGSNVPSWWRPMVPRNSEDYNRPDAVFTMMMNAMIPYLSPEDQVTVGRQLYTMWGNDFSMYKDLDVDAQISAEQSALGIEGTIADVSYFRSPQRGADAVRTLSNMRESTVGGDRWKFGPGYKFIQELMEAFGNVGKTTRAGTVQTLGQIDPLLSASQSGELAPYNPLANMLTNPFFSRFQLTPTSRTASGEYIFGKPSKQYHF